ncbi:MAG: 50S ribosomal protein L32 [Planctomycetota bacterium]
MAVPKRKHSKSRRDRRRAHDFLTTPSLSVCPECGQSKMPHRVCKCGFYKGVEYISSEKK